MLSKSLKDRFNTSREELARLGSEFNSEAFPLLEKLYNTSYWILLNKGASKKIIRQTFFEAIENCDITKNYADWQSWIQRIWMREILDFYSKKENDTQTIFDFIDHAEVNLNDVKVLFSSDKFKSRSTERELTTYLEKLPAVLRIPMIMKEIHALNYEKIAELIDVPDGVIATRIYRARKLLYLFLRDNFDFDERKRIGVGEGSVKMIFDLRRCALLVDEEFNKEQEKDFIESMKDNGRYETEILIQSGIKKLFLNLSPATSEVKQIRDKIERKANKRFGNKD